MGYILSDIYNKLHFGRHAPVAHERIWLDPRKIRCAIPDPCEIGLAKNDPNFDLHESSWKWAKSSVGRVIPNDSYNPALVPLMSICKINACLRHWSDGVSWEESGAINNLLFKIKQPDRAQRNCVNRSDVISRYQKLDEIYAAVRRNGYVSSSLRRGRLIKRERDGIEVHLGYDGVPIFGDSGTHRLAMALALKFEIIPAALGFVHETALHQLPKLRCHPLQSTFPK